MIGNRIAALCAQVAVGLGRMVHSYPELPADVLADGRLTRKRICRTFNDWTTAPRNGIVSERYPLDPYDVLQGTAGGGGGAAAAEGVTHTGHAACRCTCSIVVCGEYCCGRYALHSYRTAISR